MYDPTRAPLSAPQATWLIGLVEKGTPPRSTVSRRTKAALQELGLMSGDEVTEAGVAWVESHLDGSHDSRGAVKAFNRTKILDAMEAALGFRDWRDLRVRDITGRAGVSTPTVLNHFPDMTAMLRAMLERKQTEGRPLTDYETALLNLLAVQDTRLRGIAPVPRADRAAE